MRSTKTIVAWLAALAGVASGGVAIVQTASAASWDSCNGSPVQWRGNGPVVYMNTCSIPFGSDAQAAYQNGVFQWDLLAGIVASYHTLSASDCSISHGDGVNEIALVNRASIDGVNGRTINQVGACFIGSNDIDEGDVMVASDLPMTNPSPISLGNEGRSTFTHEFGHFFGFNHRNSNFAAMHVSPIPKTGGANPATVFPDDTLGLDALYGLSLANSNLLPSAHLVPTTSLLESGTLSICRSQTTNIRFYVGNNGRSSASAYVIRIRLSTSPTSTGGTTAANFTHSLAAFGEGVFHFPFTIPSSIAFGSYYIHIDLDTIGVIGEVKENDNTTRSGRVLSITC